MPFKVNATQNENWLSENVIRVLVPGTTFRNCFLTENYLPMYLKKFFYETTPFNLFRVEIKQRT